MKRRAPSFYPLGVLPRTSADAHNKGVEAATLHRQEFPYGAAAGWKWVYQGYSDGAKDTINIKGAGVWIQQTPRRCLGAPCR